VMATRFGVAKEVLEMVDDVPVPRVSRGSGEMLVQVKACSMTPGDVRMLSGEADLVKKPSQFPYIPGLDIAGVVVEIDPAEDEKPESERKFRVGDEVVGTWKLFGVGGMAQYALVKMELSALKPQILSFVEAASLCNSAVYSMVGVEGAQVEKGSRVMILGGSGGLGTALVQLARRAGATYIACTSTQVDLMKSLGVDCAIDYTKEAWWKRPEFAQNPFDVVFDCAEGLSAWNNILASGVLKSGKLGGKHYAYVQKEWRIVMHHWYDMIIYMLPLLGRIIMTRIDTSKPRYVFPIILGEPNGQRIKRLFDIVQEGGLKAVLDSRSPHPFTEEGVREAFTIHENHRGHGKIVVEIAK